MQRLSRPLRLVCASLVALSACADDVAPITDAAVDAPPADTAALPDSAAMDSGVDVVPEDVPADTAVDAPPLDTGAPEDVPADTGAREDIADVVTPDAPSHGSARVRVVAANLTSGNAQSYDPGPGLRIIQGLRPDVVLIQEWNYRGNAAADHRAFTDAVCGTECAYFREAGAQIPNGVISRWPIVASGEWEDTLATNRDFAWARIDLPGPRDLWAVSVHLLTSSAGNRNTEARALVARLRAAVPAGDYVVLGGDFNTDSRTESCVTTLGDVLATRAPYPVDNAGNGNTSGNRSKPYDWVLANPALDALEVPLRLGATPFPAGLVFDSRVYTPLTDAPPVQRSDSAAPSMQHMAVARDFALSW